MVAEQVRVVRYRYCDRLETNKGPDLSDRAPKYVVSCPMITRRI